VTYQLGYCCINMDLQSKGVTYSRDMIRKTFDQRGVAYASELALQNCKDFITVLNWNADHNVRVFRMGSSIFPWSSQYKLSDLPDYPEIQSLLLQAGSIAADTNQRITAHPDHFVKLGSAKPTVVDSALVELEHQSRIFDLMGFVPSYYNAINIHVGMNRTPDVTARWIDSFHRLSDTARARLVVENDDKANAYSTVQLVTDLHQSIAIPVTFDYFHHTFHDSTLTLKDAFMLAYQTWPTTPLFHYSESKNINESVSGNARAHADYVYSKIDAFGHTVDIDLEAKMKEKALLHYRTLFNEN